VHYQTDVPAGGSEPDVQDVANDIWNQLGTPLKECLSVDITIDELVVVEQVLKPDIGVSAAVAVGAPGFVTIPDTVLPHELVPLINFHTATASRSARGHIFMGSFLSQITLAAGGVWSASIMGLLQGFANACRASFDLGSLQITHVNPVIYSRTRHQRGQDPYTFRLTGATVKPRPTWLRSRATTP
jgi:hypothetical protein